MYDPSRRRFLARVPSDAAARAAQIRDLVELLAGIAAEAGRASVPDDLGELRRAAVVHRARLAVGPWSELALWQRASVSPAAWLAWRDDAGAHGALLPPARAWTFQPVLAELFARLDGDALEVDATAAASRPVLRRSTWVHPDGWWADFKDRPWVEAGRTTTVGAVLREEVYPAVRAVTGALPRGVRVLDLAGGDGELAEALASDGCEVLVLDRNETALGRAAARGLAVRRGDLEAPDAYLGETWDVIVGVGALEAGVIGREHALSLLPRLRAALRPGGLLVLTGTGAALVGRADLEAAGFTVHNTALPPASATVPVRGMLVAER